MISASAQRMKSKPRSHSLVRDELEHNVVEQGELLCDLQRRVALEGFGLPR